MYCINLERRKDRKDSMQYQFSKQKIDVEFVNAVDGKLLEPSDELKQIFRDNDFYYRRGVIGCAMSHINLWKRIVEESTSEDVVCIFEDDVTLCSKYKKNLRNVVKKIPDDTDVLFLSYHTNRRTEQTKQQIIKLNHLNYIGGTHNYIITTKGAKKMLEIISTNGIQNAIDVFMKKQCNHMKIYEVTTFLSEAEWVQTTTSKVDSDIQLTTNDSLFTDLKII
jgi:glycosyl transferase family 25